ncbi:hypothetical protein NPIL_253121, partial [Nephila pilipes]
AYQVVQEEQTRMHPPAWLQFHIRCSNTPKLVARSLLKVSSPFGPVVVQHWLDWSSMPNWTKLSINGCLNQSPERANLSQLV